MWLICVLESCMSGICMKTVKFILRVSDSCHRAIGMVWDPGESTGDFLMTQFIAQT